MYLPSRIWLLLFFVSLATSSSAQLKRIDLDVLREMMEHRHEDPTELNQFFSNSTNYVSILAPISILVAGYISDNRTTIQKGWFVGETLVASSLITTGLKYSVHRTRPFNVDHFIVPAGSGGSPSFPSGHTSEAFATATSLTMAWPKWYVAIPAFTWAGMVGYSRMYLGVHYPSDVAAGALVGVGSAWLMYKGNQWLHRHKTNYWQPVM